MRSVAILRIFEEMKGALTLMAVRVNASNKEQVAAVGADRPRLCNPSLFGTTRPKHILRLTPIMVNAGRWGRILPGKIFRSALCGSTSRRRLGHMRALRLTAVKVNAWARNAATGDGMDQGIPQRSARFGGLSPFRGARPIPVTSIARPALHLFTNTQSQGCKPWEARS